MCMKVQSIRHTIKTVCTPSAIVIGATGVLIGAEATGIKIHSGAGSFVANATRALRIPPARPWLGGTPMRSAESLQDNA